MVMDDLCHSPGLTAQNTKPEHLTWFCIHSLLSEHGTFHDTEKVTEMGLSTEFNISDI